MTRKAGQRSEATRKALLEAATAEFAECGFQKASLRTICSNAGVTTGALYFFFKNKDELFQEVIAPAEQIIDVLVAGFSDEEFDAAAHEDGDVPEEVDRALEGLYEMRDAVSVVLNNRDVPAVGAFFNRAVELSEKQIERAFAQSGQGDENYDPFLVHWYAHLQVEMVLHMIEHSSSAAEAKDHMAKMARFIRGGLGAISRAPEDRP